MPKRTSQALQINSNPRYGELVAKATQISQYDPERGYQILDAVRASAQDPSSPIYRPYAQATNKAGQYLYDLGIDVNQFGSNWYEEASPFIRSHLSTSDSGSFTKPGKKASDDEWRAYYLEKYHDAEETTKKAKSEYNAAMNELYYLTGNGSWNYDDQQVKDHFYENFDKKYPTLSKMRNSGNEPILLNDAVDFGDDVVDAAIWSARNDFDGSLEQAMAYSYLGAGKQWQEDPETKKLLQPLNDDGTLNADFLPYACGSTNLYEAGLHFGMYYFPEGWTDENINLKYNGTEEDKKYFAQVEEAENNRRSAESALDAIYGYMNSFIVDKKSTDFAGLQEKLDTALANGKIWVGTDKNGNTKYSTKARKGYEEVDLSILNKMDVTTGKNGAAPTGDLLPMTRGINYKYNNFVRDMQETCERNAAIPTDTDSQNSFQDDAAGTVNSNISNPSKQIVTEPEQAPAGPINPAAVEEKKKEEGISVQPSSTAVPAANAFSAENAPAGKRLSSPTDLGGIHYYTDTEKEQINEQNKNIQEAADTVADIATDNENTVMKYAGSVIFGQAKSNYTMMRTTPKLVQSFTDKAAQMASVSLLDTGLNTAHDIARYNELQAKYDADKLRYDQLEAKYGNVEDYQKEFKPEIAIQVGDYTVELTYQHAPAYARGKNKDLKAGYQVTNIYSGAMNADYEMIRQTGRDEDIIRDAQDEIDRLNSEANSILAKQNEIKLMGPDAEKEIQEYNLLTGKINEEKAELDSNRKQNEENVAELKKQSEKLNMLYTSATLLGLDTSKVEETYNFLDDVLQYYDEPQLPIQYQTKIEYLDDLEREFGKTMTSWQKSQLLHNSMDMIDQKIQKIQDDLAFAQKSGYQIPDRYAKNMQLKLDDLQKEKKAIEYSAILTDTKPEEFYAAYEAGKAFEEKYAGDMQKWQGLYGTEDSPEYYFTLGEKTQSTTNDDDADYPFITEDDRKVYYYLLGKKVQELGGDLESVIGDESARSLMTQEARELITDILKDADDYVEFMNDKDIGTWTARRSENSAQMGKDMVNSGAAGGVAANVAATGITFVDSLANIGYSIDRALTGDRFSEIAPARLASKFKSATREATFRSIDEAFKDDPTMRYIAKLGYEIYVNQGDSMVNAMFFGALLPNTGIAALDEFIGASPMGITAAMDAAEEAVANGASTEQAWFIFGTTFIAETASEAITYSNIQDALGTAEELTKESLKQFAVDWLTSEGIEEMIGETANQAFENWANRKATEWFDNPNYESDHQKLIDQFYAQGYTNPGEAEAKAYEQEMKDLVHTAFVSYLTPGTNVATKTVVAAANTAKTAAEVVNGYRNYTRGRQKIGYGESIIDYMVRDLKKNKNNQTAPAAQVNTEASAQEAGAAAPENAKPAAMTYEAANDAYTAAKTEYETASKEERKQRRNLNKAKQEYKEAVKSGNQERIDSAQAAVDEARQAYDDAKQVKEDARIRRDEANNAKEAAGRAEIAATATPEQKQAAADVAALERNSASNATSQTELIASILDNGDGDGVTSDHASAAATFLNTIFGNNTSYVVQQVLTGATSANISREMVTTALQNAALGDGAATALVRSEAFMNATAEEKAQMLVSTIEQDQSNGEVQKNIAAKVKDFRVTMGINALAGNGHFTQARADLASANKAAMTTAEAKTQLQEKQDAAQAAQDNLESLDEEFQKNPKDTNILKEREDALTKRDNADESQHQYEQHLENTQEAQKEAEAKAEQSAAEAMNTARETAEQAVAQEDQQRADMAAQKAEEQRKADEAAAQAQAEEDERTGKAQEDRENAAIEQTVASENKEGIEAEKRKQELKEQAEKVKIKLRDLSKPVSNAEGVLALAAMERKLGIKINLADMGAITKDGWTRGKYSYDKKTGEASITVNQNMTIGQALVEAALHEITHSMRNTNAYKAYRDVVLNSIFKESGDLNSLYENNADFRAKIDWTIAEREAAGDENFVGKSHEDQIAAAEDEIVADFARMNLAEKDVVQRFMDAGMGGKMRNTLHNINQALKNYLSNMSSEERKQAEYFRRAERAFQKAMNEVAKTSEHPEKNQFSIMQIAKATGMTFNEKTLQLFDRNGNEIDGVNNRITTDMIQETPVGMLIDNGLTGEQNVKAKEMMAGLMNMVARYKDSDLVWEIGATTLNSTFSALKSNSDPQYKTTVDFGTVCAKTQAIIDTLSQVMLDRVKEGKYGGLSREDIMKVYDAVNQAGLSVPCPVCYVFSRWMGVPSLLGQMSQYQHDYVALNEDGSIDKKATQKNVDKYIKTAESKYGDAKAINNQKTKIQNKLVSLEEKRIALEKELRGLKTDEEKAAKQKEIDSVLKQMTDLDNQLGEVNAYNWITQALCKKDKSGKYVVDDKFQITPDEILFDLNRTGEFAGYEKNWRYRNTRGAGMGKAIMPYSGETIGDVLYGVKKGGRQSSIKNPWLNMDSKAAAKQLREAQNRAIKQNLVGGQRLQSTSDFRPEWGLDYIMSFLELQAAGSKVQMYTKVAEAVDFFASVGADVNMSIMGKGQGWHVDDDGNYVLDFSSITGMDYETAKELKNKYNNVQMILVGMNDTHIRLAMANSDIDFIIPWHSSGNSKDVLAGLIKAVGEKLDSSVDYSDTQTDKVSKTQTAEQKAIWDARMKLLTKGGNALTEADRKVLLSNPYTADLYKRFTQKGVDADCYGVKLSKEQANQIFPYEYWDTSLTKDQADQNGKRFVEYCESMGIVPRFSQFKDDTGYWKLLIDRPMYNNDGTYHQQQVIDVTNARIGDLNESGQLENSDLPTQAQAKYAPKDPRNANYAKYTAAQQQAVENAEAMINNRYDDGSEGSYSVYGEMSDADREMLRQANEDYMAAVERGDTQAEQEAVDFVAEQNGFDTQNKAYHGSDAFGFTQFDLDRSQNQIFVAYNQDLAGTYTKGRVREIGNQTQEQVPIQQRLQTMSNEEIIDYLKNDFVPLMESQGMTITDVRQTGDDSFAMDYETIYGDKGTQDLTKEELQFVVGQYESENSGIYQLYTRPGNQLVVNASGAKWNEISVPWTDKLMSTREIAEYAKENGYDSVRINDVIDSGGLGKGKSGAQGDIGIFFNQNDVKSADPVTYDDQGNVISPEERFSESPDIRYSEGGERTAADEAMLNEALKKADVLTQEQIDAYNEMTSRPQEGKSAKWAQEEGPAQRQFGSEEGMLQESELDQRAIDYAMQHNAYYPDTNEGQIRRAINWIKKNGSVKNADGTYKQTTDGFNESLAKVTGKSFDYRSADGQARMIAVMAMAVAKNDIRAQVELADAFNRQGTDLGRALQSRKLFRMMTPSGRIASIQKLMQSYQDELDSKGYKTELSFSDWIYRAASVAETEEDFRKVQEAAAVELAEQLPISWQERLRSLRMMSMLANPKTHIRNIVGNALFIPAVGLKNKIGALMELPMAKGNKTKTLRLAVDKDIRQFAREDAEANKADLTGESKYDDRSLVQQNKKTLGAFEFLSDLNSAALEKEDWIFLKGHYRRALGGWMQANGYTVEQVKNNPELLEKGRAYALNEAQKATYRDFNGVAKRLNELSKNAQTPGQKALAFAVDAVLPFKKTPANILKRGIEYSPVGLARGLFNLAKGMNKGTLTPNQVIDRIASGLSGTAIMALGYLLAGTGAVTCGTDDEDWPEELKGNQKYSININKLLNAIGIPKLFDKDVTYTMDWAAPMAMPLFVGASVRNQADQEGWDVNKVLNAITSITEPVFNLSMLDGVNSVLKTSSYSNSSDSPIAMIAAKILSNYGTSYVPSVFGAINRAFFDRTQRKSFVGKNENGIFGKKFLGGTFGYAREQAENKIPVLSKSNIPVRDVWGRAKESSFAEAIIENFLSPGYIENYEEDPVVYELGRLFDSTQDKTLEPEHADQSFTYKNKPYELDAQQYDTFDRVHGETQYAMLKELVANEQYQQLSDDDLKKKIVKEIYSYATSVAKNAIDPDIKYEKKTVEGMVHDGYVSEMKDKMIEAYQMNDMQAYEDIVNVLLESGESESDLKESFAKVYRDQYKAAYINYEKTGDDKYSDEMDQIMETLDGTGFDYNYGNWEDQAEKEEEKYGNSGSSSLVGYTASNGISDVGTGSRMPQRPSSDAGWDQYMNDLDDYWASYDFDRDDPVARNPQGNIDLDNREVEYRDDGKIATEESISFWDDRLNKEVLIPTVIDGRKVSDQEAKEHYYDTGEYLGMFDDWRDADEYAMMLHNRQAWYYNR